MMGYCQYKIFILLFVLACCVTKSSQVDTFLNTQALFAYSAYCPPDVVRNWTCFWCKHPDADKLTVTATIYNKNDDSFAFVGYNEKYIQVSIRGTVATSITDWIRDLQFVTVNYEGMPDINVHLGFYKIYKGLEYDLLESFRQAANLCPKCKQVRVTGHSLGGAIATIAAMEIQNITKLPVRLANYGSPRVGNPAFAKLIADELLDSSRVVHESDIVPHVPPMMLGFHHIPIEEWLHDDDLIECDASGEDPSCSNSIKIPSAKDHLKYMGYHLWNGFPYCAGLFDVNPPSK